MNASIAQSDNDDALANVIAAKTTTVYELTPAEREEWKKALLPVHKEFESSIGADLIQSVYNTAAEVAKEHAPPRRNSRLDQLASTSGRYPASASSRVTSLQSS